MRVFVFANIADEAPVVGDVEIRWHFDTKPDIQKARDPADPVCANLSQSRNQSITLLTLDKMIGISFYSFSQIGIYAYPLDIIQSTIE